MPREADAITKLPGLESMDKDSLLRQITEVERQIAECADRIAKQEQVVAAVVAHPNSPEAEQALKQLDAMQRTHALLLKGREMLSGMLRVLSD